MATCLCPGLSRVDLAAPWDGNVLLDRRGPGKAMRRDGDRLGAKALWGLVRALRSP